MLDWEERQRACRSLERRLQTAHIGRFKPLCDFDWNWPKRFGPQARRLLALAAIYDGATRSEAAKIGGVTLQIVRDWVLKFNAQGPDGLIDRKAPGQAPRLNAEHRAALAAILESGPIPAVHGVVRWRIVDLCQFRGVPDRRLPADAEPHAARHGLSQAFGSPSPSCPG